MYTGETLKILTGLNKSNIKQTKTELSAKEIKIIKAIYKFWDSEIYAELETENIYILTDVFIEIMKQIEIEERLHKNYELNLENSFEIFEKFGEKGEDVNSILNTRDKKLLFISDIYLLKSELLGCKTLEIIEQAKNIIYE